MTKKVIRGVFLKIKFIVVKPLKFFVYRKISTLKLFSGMRNSFWQKTKDPSRVLEF